MFINSLPNAFTRPVFLKIWRYAHISTRVFGILSELERCYEGCVIYTPIIVWSFNKFSLYPFLHQDFGRSTGVTTVAFDISPIKTTEHTERTENCVSVFSVLL
jgi:hypothetical protein